MFIVIYVILPFLTFSLTSGYRCNPWACPSLPCSEPVRLPGKCCPVCPCKSGARYYNVGDLVFTLNRCITCECTKYGIECLPWPCRKPDCPNPVKRPRDCCPKCGCMVNGVFYEMGYQVTKNNPCEDCRCSFDGKVRCTNIDCPPLDCERPYSTPGTCCKKCGCRTRDGRTFDFGPLPNTDHCNPCTCQLNGTVTCEKPDCPEITCSRRLQYTPDGECCPKCSCLYENTNYRPGDVMPIPPRESCAENCSCGTDGEMVCTYPTCPVLDCPNPVLVPGECCPKCGCLDKKKQLREFGPITDDPCQPCMCNPDGNITCSKRQSCPPLICVSGFYKPNATEEQVCCPKCKCRVAGKTIRPGEFFQGPKCRRCECHQFSGRVSCEKTDCSHVKLQCANPTMRHGECCPSCHNGPTCTYKKTAISYGHYREFGNFVCTCAGDPWFPNAFCAPTSISPEMKKTFDRRWKKYGY